MPRFPDEQMSTTDRFETSRAGVTLVAARDALRRRWIIAVAILIAAVAILVVRHEGAAKSYNATASVAFQNGTLAETALGFAPAGTEPQREANTEVLIAHSSEVASAVQRQLHTSVPAHELLKEVQVEVAPSADVLNITASSGEPAMAARLANAFGEQYIAFRARSELEGLSAHEQKLRQQLEALPRGAGEREGLRQSLQRLGELRAIAGGGANIIGRASVPSAPAGTTLSTTVIVGVLVGAAVAFLAIFLLESLDKRVRSVEECERDYRLPALSGVPQSAFRKRRADQRADSLEPYRILRSALEFSAVTRRLDAVMVTSAVSGEGKTTVAVDLAHAIALAGRRTVLVELDLRRPTLAEHFKLDGRHGLTSAIVGESPVSELLHEPLRSAPNLLVLPAGRLPHNPSELLGSSRVREIISELSKGDTMVLVDAPPLNPVADAQVLLNNDAIGGVIVVARIGHVTRDDVRMARAILSRHVVEPLGLVVTGVRSASGYGYGGTYGVAQGSVDEVPSSLSRPADVPISRS